MNLGGFETLIACLLRGRLVMGVVGLLDLITAASAQVIAVESVEFPTDDGNCRFALRKCKIRANKKQPHVIVIVRQLEALVFSAYMEGDSEVLVADFCNHCDERRLAQKEWAINVHGIK